MDSTPAVTPITCTQCGGELHPDEGQIFLTCPFCGSAVYLDKRQVVFHWYLAPTLDEAKARGALARWMASSQTVKDLDQKSRVSETTFEYFPVWHFQRKRSQQQEEMLLIPAAATAISELRSLRLPAGDLRRYTPDIDSQARPPSVPLQAALAWADEAVGNGTVAPALPEGRAAAPSRLPGAVGHPGGLVLEQSLVHIPLYTFKYLYNGQTYTALVEAATGQVLANLYPAKSEAPYLAVGFLTALVFLCLALVPILGAAVEGSSDGAGIGLLICAGVGVVAAPLLFALAAWVAAKV